MRLAVIWRHSVEGGSSQSQHFPLTPLWVDEREQHGQRPKAPQVSGAVFKSENSPYSLVRTRTDR